MGGGVSHGFGIDVKGKKRERMNEIVRIATIDVSTRSAKADVPK